MNFDRYVDDILNRDSDEITFENRHETSMIFDELTDKDRSIYRLCAIMRIYLIIILISFIMSMKLHLKD